jgi:signal transduction histidine kinase
MNERERGASESGESLRLLLDSLPDGVLLTDEQGGVLFANPAAESLFGHEQGTMAGSTLGYPVLEGVTEIEIPRQDGSLVTTEIRAVRMRLQGRKLFVASFRDITERKEAEEKIVTLGQQLLNAYETINRRLGKELHDTIGQPLIGLKLALHHFRDLQAEMPDVGVEEIGVLIDHLIDSIRELDHSLRPVIRDDWSLQDALENHFQRLGSHKGLRVLFLHQGLDACFPEIIETVVFRIVEEALDNTARYAGVQEAEVSLYADGERLTVTIADEGCGFDPATVVPDSIGLRAMRERAELAGGTVIVDSAAGAGTRITAILPLGNKV